MTKRNMIVNLCLIVLLSFFSQITQTKAATTSSINIETVIERGVLEVTNPSNMNFGNITIGSTPGLVSTSLKFANNTGSSGIIVTVKDTTATNALNSNVGITFDTNNNNSFKSLTSSDVEIYNTNNVNSTPVTIPHRFKLSIPNTVKSGSMTRTIVWTLSPKL